MSVLSSSQIDVIDSCTTDNGFLAAQRRLHPKAVLCSTVKNMVSGILGRAGATKITRLRIFGHGNQGLQAVGGGQNPNFNTQVIYVNSSGRLVPRDVLALLVGRFSKTALVQLHGCEVAAGGWAKGLKLLKELADLWDVRVQAAVAEQFADSNDKFEGKYYIEADGSYNRNVQMWQYTQS